jgi:hypothetical protein
MPRRGCVKRVIPWQAQVRYIPELPRSGSGNPGTLVIAAIVPALRKRFRTGSIREFGVQPLSLVIVLPTPLTPVVLLQEDLSSSASTRVAAQARSMPMEHALTLICCLRMGDPLLEST